MNAEVIALSAKVTKVIPELKSASVRPDLYRELAIGTNHACCEGYSINEYHSLLLTKESNTS